MKLPARIEARSEVMMGKPCIKGTRIPVYLLLQKMAAGEDSGQLLAAYPQLTKEDLLSCLEYAAALAGEEVVLTEA
ncbi:MAG: DUF433 domain-containing protein [Bryobacterales bacterium]|nr:DUF433 domain-containing protein [Bryobacterales bacterium]